MQRQYASLAVGEMKVAGRAWLADVETSDPLVSPLFLFSQAIGPNPSEWDHYNAQLERFYEKYEAYLNEKNEYEKLLGRTAPLELKMLNAGESIARDLLVKMTLPEGILLYTERDYPKKPVEPLPPEKPSPVYEKMLSGSLPMQKPAPMAPQPPRENSIITDLNIAQRDGYDVTFRVKKLPQQGRLVVGKFYVVFPDTASAQSFSIEYQVFDDSSRPLKEGVLNIKVVNDGKG
jgi:hypothetical protein